MNRDLDALERADGGAKAAGAALRVAQNTTDLRLRYEPVLTVDRARLALWARQLLIDAKVDDAGRWRVTSPAWSWCGSGHGTTRLGPACGPT